jgi:hypothetical protein
MYFSSQARSPTDWKPEFSWIFRMFKAVKSAYIASADVLKPGRMNHSLKATEQDCVPAAGFQRSWLSVIQYINCLPETMFSILWLAYPPAMNHWDHGWKMSPSMIFQANWTSSSWNSQPCWNPWNLRVSSTDFAQDQRVLLHQLGALPSLGLKCFFFGWEEITTDIMACVQISWDIWHIWLLVWNWILFSISWECHHPNWQSHIFQRGRLKPPTR